MACIYINTKHQFLIFICKLYENCSCLYIYIGKKQIQTKNKRYTIKFLSLCINYRIKIKEITNFIIYFKRHIKLDLICSKAHVFTIKIIYFRFVNCELWIYVRYIFIEVINIYLIRFHAFWENNGKMMNIFLTPQIR